MKKRKSYFVPTLYLLCLFLLTIGVYFTKKGFDNQEEMDNENIKYVSNAIFSRTIPVINVLDGIKRPFVNDNVTVGRYYYHLEDDEEKKSKSIVYYEGTYMPNTGIDYLLDEKFEVFSVYEGTVIDAFDDELFGKTVKIRHKNDIISVYQGLSVIDVKKGDNVYINQKIGMSGTNIINKDLGNHLHFEIIKDGKSIDPEKCYDKNISDI